MQNLQICVQQDSNSNMDRTCLRLHKTTNAEPSNGSHRLFGFTFTFMPVSPTVHLSHFRAENYTVSGVVHIQRCSTLCDHRHQTGSSHLKLRFRNKLMMTSETKKDREFRKTFQNYHNPLERILAVGTCVISKAGSPFKPLPPLC